MSAGKNLLRRAVAAAIEGGGYNAGGAITLPGDAFHVHEDFEVPLQYQYDGVRQGTAAGTSMQLAFPRYGRSTEVELVHRVRCPLAAYSASAKPTVDRWLRAHGMSATLVTTAGAESMTYRPVTDPTWESLFGDLYTGKQKFSFTGGYISEWRHTADRLAIPEWRFKLRAPVGLPSDSAVPTITAYPNQGVGHPKGAGSSLTIQASGGAAFQGLVRESVVSSVREIEERVSQVIASGNHAGLQLGRYTDTIEVLVEATNLTASPYSTTSLLDPYRMAEEAYPATATLGFNQSQQYNRYRFVTANTAQIVEVEEERAGAIKLWRLTINCAPSTELADDGLALVFD